VVMKAEEGDDEDSSSNVVVTLNAAASLLLLAFFVCGAYTASTTSRAARAATSRPTNDIRNPIFAERPRQRRGLRIMLLLSLLLDLLSLSIIVLG
jgi:hypothetical protein